MTHSPPGFGNDDLRALGLRLRQLREQRQWSLKRLATESDVSVAAIRKIELGQSNPSLLTILSLVEALGESIDRLVSAARDSDIRITLTRGRPATSKMSAPDDRTRDLAEPAMQCSVVSLPTGEVLDGGAGGEPAFGYVLGGAVRIEDDENDRLTCGKGDAFHVASLARFRINGGRGRKSHLILVKDITGRDAETEGATTRND